MGLFHNFAVMNVQRVSALFALVLFAACVVQHVGCARELKQDGDDEKQDAVLEEPAENGAAADGDSADKAVGNDQLSIADMVITNDDFSTLVAAVTAADEAAEEDADKLLPALSGTDELTVFAPNNDAIQASLDMLCITVDQLLENKDNLRTVLQ